MARLFGIDIPNEKRIQASLQYVYGIGATTAARILDHAGVDSDIRTGKLHEDQLVRIAQVIQSEGIPIEGDPETGPIGHRDKTVHKLEATFGDQLLRLPRVMGIERIIQIGYQGAQVHHGSEGDPGMGI